MRFISITVLLGFGFFIYLFVNLHWITSAHPEELHILLNRLSLICIIIPLFAFSLISKIPFMHYWKKPQWNREIHVPLIWAGFRQTKVKLFLIIAIIITFFTFLPFVILNGWNSMQEAWLFALIFAITNALFEEVIWRGTLLSRFSELFGDKWAVIITSLGFGLQHYSLGFSWAVCIAFSIGGFFFGGITIKSNSIVPAVILHLSINVLMVFSGLF
ncbi:CPBP family intramembrane glutamic endopeptidase [Paenibacillus planticolens]|nr:type II CAAX endopeptidase family protein [Paenibacillus planticolens]